MSELLEKAIEFATKAHADQVRKYTSEPYITHPIAVMNIMKDLNFHETILCAAVLHDVVEDTPIKLSTIEEHFGINISRLVGDLTDVYTSKAFPNISRKERKMLECYRLLKVGGNAKSIKLADLIHNTISIVKFGEDFAPVYLKEKADLLFVLDGGDQRLMNMAIQSLLKSKKELSITQW